MITAPAPIIAAARPAWPAFSDSSARASANSFPISFASWPTASLNSSGIERSVREVIAVPSVVYCGGAASRSRCSRTRALVTGGTLEKANGSKTRQDRQPEEGRGLTPRKALRVPHHIIQIAVANMIGNSLDLGGGLPDVGARYREIRVELPCRTPHCICQAADVFRAGRFPVVDRVLQSVGGLRCNILGCIDEIRALALDGVSRTFSDILRLVGKVSASRHRLLP